MIKITLQANTSFIRETVWYIKNNAIHHMDRLERKNCMISIGTKKVFGKIHPL